MLNYLFEQFVRSVKYIMLHCSKESKYLNLNCLNYTYQGFKLAVSPHPSYGGLVDFSLIPYCITSFH